MENTGAGSLVTGSEHGVWKTKGLVENTGSGGKSGVDMNLISEWYSSILKAVRAAKNI